MAEGAKDWILVDTEGNSLRFVAAYIDPGTCDEFSLVVMLMGDVVEVGIAHSSADVESMAVLEAARDFITLQLSKGFTLIDLRNAFEENPEYWNSSTGCSFRRKST